MRRGHVLATLIQKNNYKTGAEIGVRQGATTRLILNQCKSIHWVAVDDWRTTPGDVAQVPQSESRRMFHSLLPHPRITLLEMSSFEASQQVEDGSLDIVFIDAGHDYVSVSSDIEFWTPKVREGGILAGHDYNNPLFPDVKRAVDEMVGDVDLYEDYVWTRSL